MSQLTLKIWKRKRRTTIRRDKRFHEATVFRALGPRARARPRQPFLEPKKARARARTQASKTGPLRTLIRRDFLFFSIQGADCYPALSATWVSANALAWH